MVVVYSEIERKVTGSKGQLDYSSTMSIKEIVRNNDMN